MRVVAEHLEEMRRIISDLDTKDRRDAYKAGNFPRANLTKDLNKRYRWDLYWAAVRLGNVMPDSTDGYTMDHIDTALRRIVPDISD